MEITATAFFTKANNVIQAENRLKSLYAYNDVIIGYQIYTTKQRLIA